MGIKDPGRPALQPPLGSLRDGSEFTGMVKRLVERIQKNHLKRPSILYSLEFEGHRGKLLAAIQEAATHPLRVGQRGLCSPYQVQTLWDVRESNLLASHEFYQNLPARGRQLQQPEDEGVPWVQKWIMGMKRTPWKQHDSCQDAQVQVSGERSTPRKGIRLASHAQLV